jgi:succinate-semialdehyde dehydrogenase/glutarate-semialdehyde dehydrogenase
MAIASVNPATGEKWREFAPLAEAEIEDKLRCAAQAYRQHRRTTFAERAGKLLAAAEILEAEKDRFARLMTAEMGKPLQAARDEAAKCALVCRYYAEHARKISRGRRGRDERGALLHPLRTVGAVLAVMPWNFPFWQVFRFAAPALMAGNVGLLKHASNVPQCALAIEEIFRRAGFSEGVFQTLLLTTDQVGRVIDDARVRAVTLTGSEHAGSEVASRAGKAIKKTVLELGGSDPFIVMPSADFEAAVKTAIKARTINNGQSCIAAKRFIVHADVYEEFARRFVAAMAALKGRRPGGRGDGDWARSRRRASWKNWTNRCEKSSRPGARSSPAANACGAGNYYAPTVLADIPKNSPAYAEEFFGPVALLFRVRSIEEAIELANDTTFGLGASAWTNDAGERARFVAEIEAGAVFINAMVASDPRLPFGGVKRSGLRARVGRVRHTRVRERQDRLDQRRRRRRRAANRDRVWGNFPDTRTSNR